MKPFIEIIVSRIVFMLFPIRANSKWKAIGTQRLKLVVEFSRSIVSKVSCTEDRNVVSRILETVLQLDDGDHVYFYGEAFVHRERRSMNLNWDTWWNLTSTFKSYVSFFEMMTRHIFREMFDYYFFFGEKLLRETIIFRKKYVIFIYLSVEKLWEHF